MTLFFAVLVVASAVDPDGGVEASATTETFLRLRAVGDVMLGTSVPEGHLPPDDGANLLTPVAPLLTDADLTFANMEGPLCDSGTSTKCKKSGNCFAFRTPTSYGQYLKNVGLDLASTANNHAGDFGEACRRETEKTLDALGVTWSGPVGTVGTREFKGKKVALIAFQTSESTNDVNNLPVAKELVKSAKASHDLVIVSFHGGAEGTNATHVVDGPEKFLGENRGDLKVFTHAVIDAGADLVIGHGPHVLRGMEVYRGHLIAYSLGNFATYGRFSLGGPLGVAAVLEVELGADGRFIKGKLLPTKQEGQGLPKPDPSGQGIQFVKQLSQADFAKTAPTIRDDGTILP